MSIRTAALTYAGVLLGFKIWSIFLIYILWGGEGATEFIIGTHVLWLVIPVVLVWGPAVFWYRLFRVRRRRQELQEAEWRVDRKPPAQR